MSLGRILCTGSQACHNFSATIRLMGPRSRYKVTSSFVTGLGSKIVVNLQTDSVTFQLVQANTSQFLVPLRYFLDCWSRKGKSCFDKGKSFSAWENYYVLCVCVCDMKVKGMRKEHGRRLIVTRQHLGVITNTMLRLLQNPIQNI